MVRTADTRVHGICSIVSPSFLAAPHAGPRGRRIREACGHFRRPLENEIATQRILQDGKRNARYLLRCQRPPSQIWSEAKRFMRLLELKTLRVLSSIGSCK